MVDMEIDPGIRRAVLILRSAGVGAPPQRKDAMHHFGRVLELAERGIAKETQ